MMFERIGVRKGGKRQGGLRDKLRIVLLSVSACRAGARSELAVVKTKQHSPGTREPLASWRRDPRRGRKVLLGWGKALVVIRHWLKLPKGTPVWIIVVSAAFGGVIGVGEVTGSLDQVLGFLKDVVEAVHSFWSPDVTADAPTPALASTPAVTPEPAPAAVSPTPGAPPAAATPATEQSSKWPWW